MSKHQIQPEYGDELADAGWDCRTCLARPTLSGANADREIFIFSVQLTTSRIGNLTRLILLLRYMMNIHTCTHTCVCCVCVAIPFILDVRLVDASAGVTQEEGHKGFLHLPSAVLALIFIAKRIPPPLSLVDRTYSKSLDQPGKVVDPARGQLNREK